MTNTLAAELRAGLKWTLSEAVDLAVQTDVGDLSFSHDFASGSDDYQAAKRFHDRRSLSAGASETLDLTALSQQLMEITQTVAFSTLRALVFKNNGTATTQTIDVGPGNATYGLWELCGDGGSNGGYVRVHPSGVWFVTNKRLGWQVTSTTKQIKVTNNDGSNAVTYDIYLLGT